MKALFCSFLAVLFLSSISLAQMRLELNSDLFQEDQQSFLNNNYESNLKLEVPAIQTLPGDLKDFHKGLFLLGFLADVTFPLGSDSGFKHIAGTAFSGHVVASYFLSESFFLSLRAGYIKFATQTTEESGVGYNFRYEDKYSQIPILFGAYYSFITQGAIKPYLGAALGIFIQTYAIKWEETGLGGYNFNLDQSFSNTGFGIVPAAGLYFLLGSVVLQAAVEYAAIFTDVPKVEYNYTYSLAKTTGTTQEFSSESTEKPAYFSVNLGLSFPLGGK
jgi:outer membrane protein W